MLALQPSASYLGAWTSYPDTWDAGQPAGGGPTGQPSQTCGQLYAPAHGFGKVWREHPEVRQLLGYALGPSENGQPFTIQPFLGGLVLDAPGLMPADPTAPHPGGAVFVLYDMGRFELPNNYSIACR
ncbi:MAG TPA: hypothetical protein VFW96_22860 [Thermomicrobiales bacterium]|nr:hypothetical protein [Thermomicrobiales bacterium]